MLAPEFINKILEKLELKKPCQAGYEQIGMKMKNGKKVPNCVPIEAKEELSRVELSYTQELRTLGQKIIKNNEKAEKELAKLKNFIRSNANSVKGYSNENFRLVEKMLRTYKQFQSEAKKIGLEVPSGNKEMVTRANDEATKTNRISFEAEKILKSIN